jgi:hypothetical protein
MDCLRKEQGYGWNRAFRTRQQPAKGTRRESQAGGGAVEAEWKRD